MTERNPQTLEKISGEVMVTQQRSGFWSDTAITPEVVDLNLDLLVRCSGLGIERGPILTEGSRLGILGLHHGYNGLNHGEPVGLLGDPLSRTIRDHCTTLESRIRWRHNRLSAYD